MKLLVIREQKELPSVPHTLLEEGQPLEPRQ